VIEYLRADRIRAFILIAQLCAQLAVIGWDLPSTSSWENDGVAPRDIPVGIAQNLTPGDGFRYPLFHLLVLGVPCLPFLAPPALAAPSFALEDLRGAVLHPVPMTGCSLVAKLVAVIMGLCALVALDRIARRIGPARAAHWALLFAAANVSVAYYGRTSNLDGPALMWTALAIDRLMGAYAEGRQRDFVWVAVFAAAAVATKDQAYASFVFVIPILAAACWRRPRALLVATGAGALAYAVLSGAVFNPTGFITRLHTLTGPAADDYRAYTPDLTGRLANLADLAASQGDFFWPWPIVALAWAGVALAALHRPHLFRLLPFLAGLGSVVAFALVVGRCEHRFVLSFGFFLAVYAGLCADAVARHPAISAAIIVLALSGPLALALTQWGDARHAAETWLDRWAEEKPGTTVETYGALAYMPRFDTGGPLFFQRVGPEPAGPRDPLLGMRELVGSPGDVRLRSPDVIVVTEGYSERYVQDHDGPGRMLPKNARAERADRATLALVSGAVRGHVPGYRLALAGEPSLPAWATALGLHPRSIHASAGQKLWVLVRADHVQ
jgi:hypothetical protein